jgi:polysaccharide export outer membrane protein
VRLTPSLLVAAAALAPACRSEPPRVLATHEAVPPPDALVATSDFEYRVGPGDVLRVNVFGHPELSTPPLTPELAGTPIDGRGRAQLPLIGAVDVAGLGLVELAAHLETRLARYLREPHVDVAVVRFGSRRYLVFGEVAAPGVYGLERPTSAIEALAKAGGLGPQANRAQVAWVRGPIAPENLVLLNASEIDPAAAGLVGPGDLFFVGRRAWADVAEAAKEIIPLLQTVTIPISIALQAATLKEVL